MNNVRLLLLLLTLYFPFTLQAQCPITVDAGEDIYLCAPPTPTQLNGSISGDYLNFFWTPTTGMTGSNTLTPTVTVTQNMTYVLTARSVDLNNNLIVNGDFESGNSDFSSDYTYSPGNLVPEGVYNVLDNPQNDHPSFAPCDDHTSGSGNMMAVNGAGVPNQNVWCQTVSVSPNTQYAFSAWVTTLVAASPALLQFSINGTTIGPIFSAPSQTCNWINFYTTWNSGSNSSATICIVNQNTTLGGNDFALDDLVFSPICTVSDTVQVKIVNIQAVAAPVVAILPCAGAPITLSGQGSSTGPDITYLWTTDNGNIVSGATTLNPVVDQAGLYTLTVTFNNGSVICEKTATVNVIESPSPLSAWITPPQPLGCGGSSLTLLGNSSQPAFSSYQWSTVDGNIVSGATSKNAVVNQPGTYSLLVTNTATGCTATAEVTVQPATNIPVAQASATDTIDCIQTQAPLSGAGSTTGANITYTWTTIGGALVGATNTINATAGAGGLYILSVTNTSNNCTTSDTTSVLTNIQAPVINLAPPGVLDCDTDTLTLSASVTPAGATLNWTASGGGQIAGGANTPTPQITAAGIYTLTATNPLNSCTATASDTVTADLTPPLAVVQPPGLLTCQQPALTLSGAGSSVGPNFTYLWTTVGGNIVSGDTTLSPTVNAAGAYTLLVTNLINACTATAGAQVVADSNVVTAIANAPDTLDCVTSGFQLDANGSSSGPTITYLWTAGAGGNIVSGDSTATPSIDAPGVYTLLVTNTANGCTASDVATVLQNLSAPQIQIDSIGPLTCANPVKTLPGVLIAPPSGIAFAWSTPNGNIVSGQNTLTPAVNAPGVYTLLATNPVNGCTAQDSITVELEAGTPSALIAPPDTLTCVATQIILNAANSSSGTNFTNAWTATAGGNIVSGQTSLTPTVNAPGIYTLTITNQTNGCTATATATVAQNTAIPPADAGAPFTLTCAQPGHLLTANAPQPDSSLQYLWQTANGQFTGNPNAISVGVNSAGTYTLLVTDPRNGCTKTDTVQIAVNQQIPALSIATPNVLTCIQTTSALQASASGNGPLTYQWQTSGGNITGGGTSATAAVDAPGTYSVLVTNTLNGCTATAGTQVAQDTLAPQPSIAPPGVLTCALPAQTLQATLINPPAANFSYAWTGPQPPVSGANSAAATVTAPGAYTLLATNLSNGCTATASVTVDQNIVAPAAEAGPSDTLSCLTNSLTIGGSGSGAGPVSFAWTAGPGGVITGGGATPTPTVSAPGTYTLLATDLVNGCTATDHVQIFNDVNAPQAAAGAPVTLTCSVTQTALNATASSGPAITYAWTAGPGGNIVSGANTLAPTVNAPGAYTLLVTNLANGCTAMATATANQDIAPPPVSIAPPGLITCANPSQTLQATPLAGTAYTWQTSNGQILGGANTPALQVGQPGLYTLTATNNVNGCTTVQSATVGSDTQAPLIGASAPTTLTCAQPQVSLAGVVQQPAANFTASWTAGPGANIVSGANTLTPLVSQPGLYTLLVTNQQNGCTATASTVAVQNIVPPSVTIAPPAALTCAQTNRTLQAVLTPPTAPGIFNWSGPQIVLGANTPTPTVTAPGLYSLTVTDPTNGCTTTSSVVLTENIAPPLAVIAPPLTLTCARDTVTLSAAGSSSGPTFTAAWTTVTGHFAGGQTTLSPQVDQPGLYTLTVTNQQNGCTASATATVQQDILPPLADAGPGSTLHCNNPTATLQGSGGSGSTLAFSWTTADGAILSGANTPTPTISAGGSYQLVVTNLANGCTASDAVAVTAVPPPTFMFTTRQPDCHQPLGEIEFTQVSGGQSPFVYSVNGGDSFFSSTVFSGLQPDDYELVVEDAFGCTASSDATIEPPFLPQVQLPALLSIDLGDSVRLEPQLNLPAPYVASWQWTPAEGLSCADCPRPFARPFYSTTYRLTITDLNGCTASAQVALRVDRQRSVYAPTAITPDNDGENSRFGLYGKGVTGVEWLKIYDRWGNQVYQGEDLPVNDPFRGWDGSFNGKAVNPGVFVWMARVRFIDGEVVVLWGDVTVVR